MKGKSKKKAVSKDELIAVLIKKALGYDVTEVVEEYAGGEEGEVKLLKKKVTVKNIPPDITALKLLIDERQQPVEEMTDEQIQVEKERLLTLLGEIQKNKGDKT